MAVVRYHKNYGFKVSTGIAECPDNIPYKLGGWRSALVAHCLFLALSIHIVIYICTVICSLDFDHCYDCMSSITMYLSLKKGVHCYSVTQ